MAGVVRGGGVDERFDEALLAHLGIALDRGRAGIGRGVDHFLAGLGACDAMIRPNSTSDSSGADEARWEDETMASRTDTGMGEAGKGTDRRQNVGELLTIWSYAGIRDNPARVLGFL